MKFDVKNVLESAAIHNFFFSLLEVVDTKLLANVFQMTNQSEQ